jgi:formamidopyrimidine-DNA glycosylase
MPELPEVEIVRRFLEKSVLNQEITKITVLNQKSFNADLSKIIGQKITKLTRQGKQLSAHLSNKLILLFHLKMTGQLILTGDSRTALGHPTKDMLTSSLPNKSTRVIFKFANQTTLYFNDQRKFGWIKLFSQKDLTEFQSSLGIDLLDDEFTFLYFQSQISQTSRPIKSVLLDQSKFAGIGNIYANDALFLAGIHPSTPSNRLSISRSKKLYQSLLQIINDSISHGGSTAKDQKYLRPDGTSGTHQFHFHVYQKAGESCSKCQTPIQRIKLSGRGTFFCPRCQKL